MILNIFCFDSHKIIDKKMSFHFIFKIQNQDFDPLYRSLCLLTANQSISNEQQILQEINEWKNMFSLKWYKKFIINNPVEKLCLIWKLLFNLAGDDNTNISILAFNAIGALLLSISPFDGKSLIKSFSKISGEIPASPSSSIAVISSFAFLLNLISPHLINDFCNSTLVLLHFSSDLKDYIKFLPNLVEKISGPNLDFFRAMLRTILVSFSKNPNLNFVEVVIRLLEKFPKELMDDLFEFIIANDLNKSLLAIGDKILESSLLRNYLSEKQISLIFDEAKNCLNDTTNFSALEYSVGIINVLYRNKMFSSDVEHLINNIWKKEYPGYILKVLLPLTVSFDFVIPKDDDSLRLLCAKIKSFKYFDKKYYQDIINILTQLLVKGGDVFCEIVNYLSLKLNDMISNNIFINNIVYKILKCEDVNWNQIMEIINLIDTNDQFLMNSIIPYYTELCVHQLINGAISPNDKLSEYSRAVSSRFIGENSIGIFINELFKLDFFNIDLSFNALKLLNSLCEIVDISLFKYFIPIFLEITELNDVSCLFQSELFLFLSNFSSNNDYNSSLIDVCFNLLQKYYWSFTGIYLFNIPCNTSEFKPIFTKNTSDISSGKFLQINQLLNPLNNCYKFLKTINHPKIIQISEALVQIFPLQALPVLLSNDMFEINELTISNVLSLFNQSNDLEVLKLCLDLLVKKSIQSLSLIKESITFYLKSNIIKTAPIFYSFFTALYNINDVDAVNSFISIVHSLDYKDKNNIGVMFYSNNFNIWFNDYVHSQLNFLYINDKDESKKEKALNWFKNNQFKDWPVINEEFNNLIKKNIEDNSKEINDFNTLDLDHWKFLLKNQNLFKQEQLEDNIFNSKNIMKNKYFISKPIQYSWNDKLNNNKLDPPSLTPFLSKSIYTYNSEPLLKSFFEFSNINISKESFDEINSHIHSKELRELSQKYSERIFGSNTDSILFDYNSLTNYKSKQLHDLCIKISNTKYINVSKIEDFLSHFDIENLIEKPKRLFYCLRIYSIFIQECNEIKKMLPKQIFERLDLFQNQPAYILKELKSLSFNLTFTSPKKSLKFSIINFLNDFYSIQKLTENILYFPSFSLMQFRLAIKYPNLINPFNFSKESLLSFISSPLCGMELINYLFLYPEKLNNVKDFLDIILDSSNPLFSYSISFLINLIGTLDERILDNYQSFFKSLSKYGYNIYNIIRISTTYFHTLNVFCTNEIKKNEIIINESFVVGSIFENFPSFENTMFLSHNLLSNSYFFDCIFNDLFERIKYPEIYYPSYFIIISQVYKYGNFKMKDSINDKYNNLNDYPFLSRKRSLQFLLEESNFMLGLLCSFLETNDLSIISDISNLLFY